MWVHKNGLAAPPRSLHDLTYRSGRLEYRTRHATEPEWALMSYLEDARAILAEPRDHGTLTDPPLSDDFNVLRWFPLPSEIAAELRGDDTPRRELALGRRHG
jgi:hypothetical protein